MAFDDTLNRYELSPDERKLISDMLKSPAWSVAMLRLFEPALNNMLAQQDRIGVGDEQRGFVLGSKSVLKWLMHGLYEKVGIESPLQRHRSAFITALSAHLPDVTDAAEKDESEEPHVFTSRVSVPIE